MECGVCEIRSSIGYCIKCQKLLCETCSETCDLCGKLMCPDHVYESRSGKIYCTVCNDRRQADRKEKVGKHRRDREEAAAGGSSLESLSGVAAEDEELDGEMRVLGQREPVQPWRLCMNSAIIALLLAIFLMIFPSFRRIPMGGTSYIVTPYFLIIIPLIATFWGVYGMLNIEFYKYRQRCMAGLGIAALSFVMFIAAVASDPNKRQEQGAVKLQERREVMDEQQLEGWRDNVLDKYR